ncbi:cytochrome P450 [Halovivax limisalsi]|uniref:cytochrome P450 n=1 Tax=Halovivax limisalsi TaxID=1453760 RepID=UPI001FFCF28A|nr:cytochrome P450 [Halovivax limisalsi]
MSDPKSPPSPDGLPVLGTGLTYARDPLGAYERWANQGDVVSLRLPGQQLYLVSEPELIETVLLDRDRFVLSEAQREVFAGLEDHAVTATRGDEWRRLRNAIGPAFSREAIDRYADGVVAAVASRVDAWDDGERVDLHREMRLLSLTVLTTTLLDVEIDGYEDVILDAADATIARADLRRPGQLLPDWVPTPTERRFRRAVRELDAFVASVIEDRRDSLAESADGGSAAADSAGAVAAARSEAHGGDRAAAATEPTADGSDPSTADTDSRTNGSDVASALFAARDRGDLTTAELRDNLVAMLLGGHDSAAVAFTYAWYLLSQHPDERDRLVDEYEAAVERAGPAAAEAADRSSTDRPSSRPLDAGALDLDDLSHARRIVDETLRLFPPAPVTARQTTRSVTLGGYRLPAGAQVLCPQWVCHRDERWWDDPETFDPSRWDGEADRPDYAYFPFGGGPRYCIGAAFARQELTLGLATMAGRCALDVDADEPLSLAPSITLRPETDLPATVRKRAVRAES